LCWCGRCEGKPGGQIFKERRSWSGKKKINDYKLLSVRYYSIATNGALEGDGCLGCSYKNLGNDAVKKNYGIWHSVR